MAQFEIIALDTGTTDQLRAPGSGDSYIANRAVAIAVGTLTTDIKPFDVSATWNNAGVTFTGLRFNVTDTASNAVSLLFDWQVGGASRASLTKGGLLTVFNGVTSTVGNITAGNAVVTSSLFSWINGDLYIARDAANTLAQRNGTNAQTDRLYGTYTDVSNYRRLVKTMNTSGVAEIKVEGAGTGSSGNVLHISGLPTSNPGPGILWNNAGTPAIGT